MLSIQDLSLYFGADPLFSEISFVLNDGEKAALAGFNGAGKTTLLNIIAGKQKPSSGHVAIPSDHQIGYLPQHLLLQDNKTVWEEAETVFQTVLKKREALHKVSEELAAREDYDSSSYMDLAQQVSNLSEELALLESERHEALIEKTLKGLGFSSKDFNRPTSEFSGGWRMRLELAKILLRQPDILLLDEPTNHLDVESIVWLENFLKTAPCSLLLVSHDKAFLDNVTTRTLEISNKKIYDYKVPYSQYLQLREERYEQEKRAYENQQKNIKDTEAFIERFRYKSSKAVQVQSRIKQLEKLERIEVETIERRSIHFRFPMRVPSGSYPIRTDNLKVRFDEHEVLKGINIEIERGEKIAIVGKNGAGKTTFLRAILNELKYEGKIELGHNVEISYFSQNAASKLDPHLSIYETIDRIAVGDIRTRINDILGAFMFAGETSEKKVEVLSGGEKSRLALIKLLLEPGNVLILDEPTNHLDIHSKSVLKEAIEAYEGTVIIVSHDRDFLSGLVGKVIEIVDGKAVTHLGGIEYYLRELQKRVQEDSTEANPANLSGENPETSSEGKKNYEEQKNRAKAKRKIEKEVAELEKSIEEQEAQLASIEAQLNKGESSESLLKEYASIREAHAQTLTAWEQAFENLETFNETEESC